MDLGLAGKKAIVTGGSRGIGKAIAWQLAREGCEVAICSRNEGPLRQSADEIAEDTKRKVLAITCNTLSAEDIRRFVAQAAAGLGGIQIVVNSAARPSGRPGIDEATIENVDMADVRRDFEEKVLGYLRMVQAAIPHLKQAGWGRVINISGGTGRAPGIAVSPGVRNAAVVNMTKSMANVLGPYRINVNAVYPGRTITEDLIAAYSAQAERESTTVEALMKAADERTLLKRVMTAADVANVVAFLCSPMAVGIHGEAIAVDGGNRADMHY